MSKYRRKKICECTNILNNHENATQVTHSNDVLWESSDIPEIAITSKPAFGKPLQDRLESNVMSNTPVTIFSIQLVQTSCIS